MLLMENQKGFDEQIPFDMDPKGLMKQAMK